MRSYVYRADLNPVMTVENEPVHLLHYAYKDSLVGVVIPSNPYVKELAKAVKQWREQPRDCYLVIAHDNGEPVNGAPVYRATRFRGSCLGADLASARYPEVGVILKEGDCSLRFVSKREQAEAWEAVGVTWRSVSEFRAQGGANKCLGIGGGTPESELAVRLFNAYHEVHGLPARVALLDPA